MKHITVHQVDAFTDHLFGGNPAAIVPAADALSVRDMQNLAREMNLSETAFLLESDSADFRLRFFTPPGDEIKFCGHATVGALETIARLGLYGVETKRVSRLKIETNAGVICADLRRRSEAGPVIVFDAPRIDMVEAKYTLDCVRQALGIPQEFVDYSKPLMLEKTNNYLYFAVHSLQELQKIELDVRGAIEFARQDRIIVFCALVAETFDPTKHVHARGYAPLVGVPEDPFTGSMQGGVAAYLVANSMIPEDATMIGSEQGHILGRPGSVDLEIIRGAPLAVRLHANAVPVFSAEVSIP